MGILDVITSPITGVTNALNGIWNDYTGKTATDMSISASKANTEKQLAWERERATNAHQWEIKDLEKAGINPILSAGGSGAATGGISPQMPDVSNYKGWGAIIPLISSYFDNQLKNANTAKAMAEAKSATENVITQKSTQVLNAYNIGLIDAKKAGQMIENEINEINKDWLPWEKGVGIAKDVAQSIMPMAIGGYALRGMGNTATQLSNGIKGIRKDLKAIRPTQTKNGTTYNQYTGQIYKEKTRKNISLDKDKINNNLPKYKTKYTYDPERGGYWKQKVPIK